MVDKITINIFETTDRCRYIKICESFQTMERAERQLEEEIMKIRTGFNYATHEVEYLSSILQYKLNDLERVRERCYKYNHRCLRFWQFKRREENESLFNYKNLDPSMRRLYGAFIEDEIVEGY